MTEPKRKPVDLRLLRQVGGSDSAVKTIYASSTDFRIILKKVLTEELESLIIKAEGEDIASEHHKLAHLAGQRLSLRSVLKLLEDLEK